MKTTTTYYQLTHRNVLASSFCRRIYAPLCCAGQDLGFDAVVVSAAAAATGEGERDILAELRTAFSV